MNLPEISIRRPVFITCVFIAIVFVGIFTFFETDVNLYPDVEFPVVTVTTEYPGASPEEVEAQVSKRIEDAVSGVTSLKKISSSSLNSYSIVTIEFYMGADMIRAQNDVKSKVDDIVDDFPDDVKTPTIVLFDVNDTPIMQVALSADLEPADLYDLADLDIRHRLEQVNNVAQVKLMGGRKRQIKVYLDREEINKRQLFVSAVAGRLADAGQNVPSGKVIVDGKDIQYRSTGNFTNLKDIEETVVTFPSNDFLVKVKDIGEVEEGLEDEQTRSSVNGKTTINFQIFRATDANTVQLAKDVIKAVAEIQKDIAGQKGKPKIEVVYNSATMITDNVDDVNEAIWLGIALTIIVVMLFLGSMRSTFITVIAIPISMIGAFTFMYLAGDSINVMTLMALSLTVGLLIDDAIVVRENIFRHMEMGKEAKQAALDGTKEVAMAVVATTSAIIAVFGPFAFMSGEVGQYFKEFGNTVCFVMIISFAEAMTMAPMMSAWLGRDKVRDKTANIVWRAFDKAIKWFQAMMDGVRDLYEKLLTKSIKHPIWALALSFSVFALSIATFPLIKMTFVPPANDGQFEVQLQMPIGTSLDETAKVAEEIDKVLHSFKEVKTTVLTVGTEYSEDNKADFFVQMIPVQECDVTTEEFKETVRKALKKYSEARPIVEDASSPGGGDVQQPFMVNLMSNDPDQLDKYAAKVEDLLKKNQYLKDVNNSDEGDAPLMEVIYTNDGLKRLGVLTVDSGNELRGQINGITATNYWIGDEIYDVVVQLKKDQQNLKEHFPKAFVPNANNKIVLLSNVAELKQSTSPMKIQRRDRMRLAQIGASLAPDGPGLGKIMQDVKHHFATDLKPPEGVRISYEGQSDYFNELATDMMMAAVFAIVFIYLVLASLYNSFTTPFTIMLVIPLATSGAFLALLITGKTLDVFSMIACIVLMGLATKNSIVLVDFYEQLREKGEGFLEAVMNAGHERFRPILMTSLALITGMIPIAIGMSAISEQRSSMGVSIIGGVISSTFLTLLVVPATLALLEKMKSRMQHNKS